LGALIVGTGVFVFFIAWMMRAKNETSLISMSLLVAYPAMVVVFGVLLTTWNRLRVMVLGGGQHQNSDFARDQQWEKGLRILQGNPVGHGAGQSGDVLNFVGPSGKVTVDTYFLTLMLDYGVVALPIFIAMFTIPVWMAWKVSRQRWKDEEIEWLVPIGVGLLSFLIIKSVMSSDMNVPVAFIMLGFAGALIARMQTEQKQTAETSRSTNALALAR
jgi:hypothetical protein